jgi:flagellar motility protein MotE (MotC chaperone)
MSEELHDPRTGFHDLKPLLPESESGQWMYLLFSIPVVLLLIWLVRRKPVKAALPQRDLRAEIEILRSEVSGGKMTVPFAASELSQRLREWIEQSSAIYALELTRRELEEALKQHEGFTAEIRSRIVEVVSRCERMAFDGDDSSTADDFRILADGALAILKGER